MKFQKTLCLTALFLFSIGCSEFNEDGPYVPGSTQIIKDYSDIKPVFDAQCVSCHSGTEPAGDYAMNTLFSIFESGTDEIANLIPGSANSKLLQVVESGGSMSGYLSSAANLSTIRQWIVDSNAGLADGSSHGENWMSSSSNESHGNFLRGINYDFDQCETCHGTNLNGGISNVSCNTCHENSLDDCTTCHGQSFRPDGSPPRDVAGSSLTSSRGVGAHQAHLSESAITTTITCEQCHVVPQTVDAAGHIDNSAGADVTFGDRATTDGAVPELIVSTNVFCQNTYCHGNFSAGIQNNTVTWDQANPTPMTCGSCHTFPPTGPSRNYGIEHQASWTTCGDCHFSVIDKEFNFIDKSKHINGKIDL